MDYGISALDPTVGLLRKELEVNNVQPGQEADYFQAKGRPLSPQLVFLIQANQQLQQSAQAAQARPPQSTVADDLSAALVQKANQGVANLMQPRMPVRTQGVAALPAGNVGNEKAYAGGGIVAFAEGGEADDQYAYPTNGGFAGIGELLRRYAEAYGGSFRDRKDPYSRLQDFYRSTGRGLVESMPGQRLPYGTGPTPREIEEARARRAMRTPGINPEAPTYSANAPFNMMDHVAAVGPDVSEEAPDLPPVPSPQASSGRGASVRGSASRRESLSPYEQEIRNYIEGQKKRRDETPEQYAARMAERDKAAGVTEAAQARKDRLAARLKEIEGDDSKSAAEKKRDMMYQLAMAGFGSVGDPRNRNLLQGLGRIGAGFAKGAAEVEEKYRGESKERKKARAAIEDAQDTMAEAEAARRAGRYEEADKLQEQAAEALYKAGVDARQFGLEQRKAEAQIRRDQVAARTPELDVMRQEIRAVDRQIIELRRRGKNREADMLQAENNKRLELFEQLAAPGQIVSAEQRREAAMQVAVTKDLQIKALTERLPMLEAMYSAALKSGDKNKIAAAEADIQRIQNQINARTQQIMAGGGGGGNFIDFNTLRRQGQ